MRTSSCCFARRRRSCQCAPPGRHLAGPPDYCPEQKHNFCRFVWYQWPASSARSCRLHARKAPALNSPLRNESAPMRTRRRVRPVLWLRERPISTAAKTHQLDEQVRTAVDSCMNSVLPPEPSKHEQRGLLAILRCANMHARMFITRAGSIACTR
jgi:hypothetical protein